MRIRSSIRTKASLPHLCGYTSVISSKCWTGGGPANSKIMKGNKEEESGNVTNLRVFPEEQLQLS